MLKNMVMKKSSYRIVLFFLFLVGSQNICAQQRLKFSVLEFSQDAFDLSAQSEETKKIDGSGSLYAIIKVTSDNPDDDLRAYQFNFGNMNHLVEDHDDQLWLYVQKNAKQVTITRQGYTPVRNYDLRTTIEAGRNYVMRLSAQGPVIYTQMVMFTIKPAEADPVVTIKGIEEGAVEQSLKRVDASGKTAKSLPYGIYSYRVLSENYFPSEGRINLNDKTKTYFEEVTLRPRFSTVTLQVDANAEIYVNGEKKGLRTWSGMLNAGIYSVECRQANHKTTTQSIIVKEDSPATFDLNPPTPITGTLSVLSDPLGANIVIDGKEYGETPRNIDLLIGGHSVTLSRDNYIQEKATVEVKENEITELNLTLTDVPANPKEKTFTVNGVSFVMKYVEGGTFMMGATPEQRKDANDNEKPAHQVTLNSFLMGESEVTQALWQAVMGSNPSSFKGDNLPVERVSWEDCQEFIRKLNEQTGQRFRLPTEAEWEYAARGGQKSRGYKYSGSNTLDAVGWYYENSGNRRLDDSNWQSDQLNANNCRTHEVKTKQPNELGIYDMSGNVWEWCQDWYGSYSSSAQSNPTGASSGYYRVLRGGGWSSRARYCRVSYRSGRSPSYRDGDLGFRLAL